MGRSVLVIAGHDFIFIYDCGWRIFIDSSKTREHSVAGGSEGLASYVLQSDCVVVLVDEGAEILQWRLDVACEDPDGLIGEFVHVHDLIVAQMEIGEILC